MAQRDFRAKLSAADFVAIPFDEECPIDNYYFTLLDQNEKFRGIREEFPRGDKESQLVLD